MIPADRDGSKHILTFRDGKSDKYYGVWRVGRFVLKHWGRNGTAGMGQSQVSEFASYGEAIDGATRMIESKLAKGYIIADLDAVVPNVPVKQAYQLREHVADHFSSPYANVDDDPIATPADLSEMMDEVNAAVDRMNNLLLNDATGA